MKDTFYQQLYDFLGTAKRFNILILAGNMNTKAGQLSSNKAYLGGDFGRDSCHSENGERLLDLCLDHRLPPASTNFEPLIAGMPSGRRSATSQLVTNEGMFTRLPIILQQTLDFDHTLICTKLL